MYEEKAGPLPRAGLANSECRIPNSELPRSRSAPPILKNRACSTLVGFSQLLVAAVENVLLTVNGQSLLKML